MITNIIERVLVITKLIFNYHNTNFSHEITSKVQKVYQIYTFTHKLTTKQILIFQLKRHGMERTALWDIKGSEGRIYAAFKNRSDETGLEANFGFGRALMSSCLGMCLVLQRQHFSVFGCILHTSTKITLWLNLCPHELCIHKIPQKNC